MKKMIENSVGVNTLFLTWQSYSDRNQRFLVGSLKRVNDLFEFSYLTTTQGYIEAVENGFLGYPAFPLNKGPFINNVLATFMKRIPPRSRRDFKKYLVNHHLPESFDGDDFDLISHTGIQLPSDGFDLVPNLSEAKIPFDYLMEVAGTRYYLEYEEVANLDIDSRVELVCEDDNEHDENAIAIFANGIMLGHVNKILCPTIRKLMSRDLSCSIAKKSGLKERPLIYVMLKVR